MALQPQVILALGLYPTYFVPKHEQFTGAGQSSVALAFAPSSDDVVQAFLDGVLIGGWVRIGATLNLADPIPVGYVLDVYYWH